MFRWGVGNFVREQPRCLAWTRFLLFAQVSPGGGRERRARRVIDYGDVRAPLPDLQHN
jgi:hypothetical protein